MEISKLGTRNTKEDPFLRALQGGTVWYCFFCLQGQALLTRSGLISFHVEARNRTGTPKPAVRVEHFYDAYGTRP